MRTNLLKFNLTILTLLALSIGLMGQTTVWNPAANNPSDGLWSTSANWTNGVPVDGNKVVFNVQDAIDCIVDTDVSADIQIVQGDNGPGGILHIKNGGVVTTRTDKWSAIGYNKPATLIVDQGGEVTFGQHMWVGFNEGADSTEIHLNGGTINVLNMFGMDFEENGASSTLYINDGLLSLANIHSTKSIGAECQIIINGGMIQIEGSREGTIQDYIDAGKITSDYDFDLRVEDIDGSQFTKLSINKPDVDVSEITVEGEGGATSVTTKNGTLQMFATILPEDATDTTVTWNVSDENIAEIDTEGLLTAKADGVVTVTATANDGSEVQGSADITISGQAILVTEITVNTTDEVTHLTELGGTLQMFASVLPEDATDTTVTWSVSDENIAEIDTDGLLTAKADGVVTVTATANDGSEVEGSVDITISGQEILVTEITVTAKDEATTITANGGTLQMFATVLPDNATDTTVTWNVSDDDIAEIDTDGLLTAKANGVVTVTATANDGSEAAGALEVTVSGQEILATEIIVTAKDDATKINANGGTLQMLATVLPDNTTDDSVIWSVNDENIAEINTDGLLTAKADGNITVTATANDKSGVSGELVITASLPASTVWNPESYAESTGLWMEKENWTQGLPHNDSKVVFNVAESAECVLNTDASIKQLVMGDNGAGDDVLRIVDGGRLTTGSAWSSTGWSSDAKLIVDQGGTLSFGGHYWVSANAHATVEIYGTLNVSGMFGIAFEPAWNGSGHVSVHDNGVLNLANIHPDQSIPEGSYLDINDNGIISLNGNHLAKVVEYINLGRITTNNGTGAPHAELVGEDDNLKTVLTVKQEVTEITVTTSNNATTITNDNDTLQMVASVLPTDASDASVTWSVSDEEIATVNGDGLLTAVSNGIVTVTATANDGSGIKGDLEITIDISETSIWDHKASAESFNIYPNPVTANRIYIKNVTNADVKIYDIKGQEVLSKINTTQLNIQNLKTGVYVVRVKAGGIIQTRKLLRK